MKFFRCGHIRSTDSFPQAVFLIMTSSGVGRPLRAKSSRILSRFYLRLCVTSSRVKRFPSKSVAVQRRVIIVFLFMCIPLIPFGFYSSYQLLIRFSTYGRGCRQARRRGAEGESKRSKEGRKVKGRGEENRRKAFVSVIRREYNYERRG
jgi:hypothetical protein